MGFTFYLAIVNNIFSICGLAGVLNAQRELVIAFFAYNAAQMVISFHFFVDMVTDAGGWVGGWVYGGGSAAAMCSMEAWEETHVITGAARACHTALLLAKFQNVTMNPN